MGVLKKRLERDIRRWLPRNQTGPQRVLPPTLLQPVVLALPRGSLPSLMSRPRKRLNASRIYPISNGKIATRRLPNTPFRLYPFQFPRLNLSPRIIVIDQLLETQHSSIILAIFTRLVSSLLSGCFSDLCFNPAGEYGITPFNSQLACRFWGVDSMFTSKFGSDSPHVG